MALKSRCLGIDEKKRVKNEEKYSIIKGTTFIEV